MAREYKMGDRLILPSKWRNGMPRLCEVYGFARSKEEGSHWPEKGLFVREVDNPPERRDPHGWYISQSTLDEIERQGAERLTPELLAKFNKEA